MKKLRWGILLILLLLMFDQGVKLVINQVYSFDGNPLQETGVHLHPEINDKDAIWAAEQTERIGLSIPFWIAVNAVAKLFSSVFLLFAIGIFSVMKAAATGKRGFRSVKYIAIFLSASTLAGVLGLLFWGGSLDWCCISVASHANGNPPHLTHYIFDLKDLYFAVEMLLILFFVLQTFLKMLRFFAGADKEAETRFWKKELPLQLKGFIRHPIRYFREEKQETSANAAFG